MAKACGVLSGMDSAGTFGGTGNLNRAQACVVLIKLDEMKDTGDGSGSGSGNGSGNENPGGNDTPTEITRSPFAFQGSENVQQMMNRLNAEAPKYYEGYLTNGKPITEENIKAMLAEAEKGMPTGTAWSDNVAFDYYTKCFPGYSRVGGCGSFAAGLSDYIFGKDAPVTKHQNFDNIKVGDAIWLHSSKTGYDHIVFVTDLRPTTADSYMYVDGNNDTYGVWWEKYGYMDDWGDTQKAETYVYSRY